MTVPAIARIDIRQAVWPDPRVEPGRYSDRFEFWDFVIDGQSLYESLRQRGIDLIPPFGHQVDVDFRREAGRRLLLQSPPDLSRGRSSLYLCPFDSDIYCGCVGVNIEAADDRIIWRDFGKDWPDWEAEDPSDLMQTDFDKFAGFGPFAFDRAEYERAIRQAAGL